MKKLEENPVNEMIELVKLITFVPSYKRFIYFGLSFFFAVAFFVHLSIDKPEIGQTISTGVMALWMLLEGGFANEVVWNMPKLKNGTAYLFKLNDNYIVSGSREEAELWADLKEEEGEIEKIGVANFFEK